MKAPAQEADESSRPNEILGWVETPMIGLAAGVLEAWRVERGYRLVIVLIRRGHGDFDVTFDSANNLMRLDDGREIQSVGVVACLEDDFRGANGQRLPALLSTASSAFTQHTGSCFGYAYAFEEVREPRSVRHGGRWTNSLSRLSPKGAMHR